VQWDNSWLGRQDVNRTFEDDVECDIAEVRGVLSDTHKDVEVSDGESA
jgi:hypothetical protein